ncbi:OmpP1/FadL family transporter [Pseudomonas agarici]|nr:outer membrane protein transport protein [Pseudomonas agarici]NWB94135.1 porin [Pseudomonas agarici]NWC07937.1 porin [Pseudomonas agarici]SEK78384.1 long-chain fatty acid transport protein [Pseudomonas agarici]
MNNLSKPLNFNRSPLKNTYTLSSMAVNTLSLGIALLCCCEVQANNGIQLPGYGAKAMGMGGASIALPQDSVESANNPAGMALVGDRTDMDLTVLHADVNSEVNGQHYGTDPVVPVPAGGINFTINPDVTAGLSVFGQGVKLDYKEPIWGTKDMKSEINQVIMAPTITYQFKPGHYIGFSPRLAYQYLDIAGFEGFGFNSPGSDHAFGYGFAVGYIGKILDNLQLGLTYSSKIRFQQLDRYKSLVPNGRIDTPQQAGLGLSYMATPDLTLAFDYLWINWAGERAYGNSMVEGGPMGASNGPGYGWRNQRIYRFGVAYEFNQKWTVRAGTSLASKLIPDSESTFATTSPLMDTDHYSVGATYNLDKNIEINGSYTRALNATVHGTGASSGVDASVSVDYLNIGMGYKF